MSEIFKEIRRCLPIRQVVEHFDYSVNRSGFTLSPFGKEKTPSCKLYHATNTFYDFSSNIGGDCIKFAAAVLGVDNWQACQYLIEAFSLPFSLSGSIENQAEIERRKVDQERQRMREQEFKAAWRKEVEFLKWWEGVCRKTLEEKRFPPFSESQDSLMVELQNVSYKLDILCAADCETYRRMKLDAAELSSDRPQWLLDILAILAEDGIFQATQSELAEIKAQRDFEWNRQPGKDRVCAVAW